MGLTTERIDQLARRDPDLPAPVADLAADRFWWRVEIVTWARHGGRLEGTTKRSTRMSGQMVLPG